MNKTLLLLALVMVWTASAKVYKMPIRSRSSIMSIMTEVQEKLKAGNPLDDIQRLLDEYISTIQTEQSAHDDLYVKQTVECTEEAAYRTKEIADATSALGEG
jgi:hypothetical protein